MPTEALGEIAQKSNPHKIEKSEVFVQSVKPSILNVKVL